MANSDRMLRVAIIGVGYWGPNYLRLLSGTVPGAQVTACSDLQAERLQAVARLAPGVKMFQDHRRMLAESELDAAIIATPASAHRQIAEDCLAAGLHLLVEKPLASTSADAEAITEAAAQAGRVLMVGHTFLFNPAVRRIKRYIEDGELGRILYLSFTRTGLGPIRQDVNALWDLAPHDVSMLRYWLDADPGEIVARGQSYLRRGTEDVVFLMLRFPGDILAAIHLSWLDPVKDRKATIVGDKKMIVFDDVNPVEKLRVYDKGANYQPRDGDFGQFVAAVRDGDILIPRLEQREPLREQVEHFIHCVHSGERPLADGEQGVAVVRILEAASAQLAAAAHLEVLS